MLFKAYVTIIYLNIILLYSYANDMQAIATKEVHGLLVLYK